MRKIAVITDMDVRGSGYRNLSIPLLQGLEDCGYSVKIAGFQYDGSEHPFSFSILPAQNIADCVAIIRNLNSLWKFDVLIVLLDIPLQETFLREFQSRDFKYIGIFPIEAPPLCADWAMVLAQMDKALVISEFGAKEAQTQGIDAEHIQIGIDCESWKYPTEQERAKLRTAMGFDDDAFVVLTVADNQERKNLSRSMEMFADFSKLHKNSQYLLVTREHFWGGWKLRSYATELGISDKFHVFERGMSYKDLWGLYAIADVFLLTSKAEGLGMPILEAMAMKVPVVATNFAGMAEHLQDGKNGYPIDYYTEPEFDTYRDPFGNGKRVFAKRHEGFLVLHHLANGAEPEGRIQNAYEYVLGRTHQISTNQLRLAIESLYEDNSNMQNA